MWQEEFAQQQQQQRQPPMAHDSPKAGSGPEPSSSVPGHCPLPASGLPPAVQRALFIRLTQRYQEDEEPAGSQPQRASSKEEGWIASSLLK